MAQASNLAKAINKLMESKLDSSLREKYFVISPLRSYNCAHIYNITTNKYDMNNIILIGSEDIIRIDKPRKEDDDNTYYDIFRGTISEAIEQGYVKGNFIFSKFEPQDTQDETSDG